MQNYSLKDEIKGLIESMATLEMSPSAREILQDKLKDLLQRLETEENERKSSKSQDSLKILSKKYETQLNGKFLGAHGYYRFYPTFLEPLREKSVKMLEIGINKKESLNVWLEYFPRVFIYGIEKEFGETGERFKIFKGDQSDLQFLKSFQSEVGSLDLIIDDGSHIPEYQLISFNFLFDAVLKDDGIYVIEDIETSYWKEKILYGSGIRAGFTNKNNVPNIFKNVVDVINEEYFEDEDLLVRDKNEQKIPYSVVKKVKTLTFCQNMIIIQKKGGADQEYDNRQYRFKSWKSLDDEENWEKLRKESSKK